MSRTSRYQELRSGGLSRDDTLGVLRQEGASPIDCIKAMVEGEGLGLGEAKRLFHESHSWADKNSEFDAFHEEMAVLAAWTESETPQVETIYVSLRNEAVEAWRPVDAVRVGDDAYRILSSNSNTPDEAWEFDRGELVVCADRLLSEGLARVAVRRAAKLAG